MAEAELPEIEFKVDGRFMETGGKFNPFIVRAASLEGAFRAAQRPGIVIDKIERYEPQQPQAIKVEKYEESELTTFFIILAVLSCLAGFIGFVMVADGHPDNRITGILLLPCIGGGFFFLGFAKIIQCLNEAALRLRNLERMTFHSQNSRVK